MYTFTENLFWLLDSEEISLQEKCQNIVPKNMIKKQTKEAAFKHLIELKKQARKAHKNSNTEISKLIFEARGRNLNIKEHKRWKYEDALCVGCKENSESENELLSCPGFSESNEVSNEEIFYSLVFGDKVSEMVKVTRVIRKRLKIREKLMENG